MKRQYLLHEVLTDTTTVQPIIASYPRPFKTQWKHEKMIITLIFILLILLKLSIQNLLLVSGHQLSTLHYTTVYFIFSTDYGLWLPWSLVSAFLDCFLLTKKAWPTLLVEYYR